MTGSINSSREAVVVLEVLDFDQRVQQIETVIDTGFNGYLTLPKEMITRFNLAFAGNRQATLGDGNAVVLDAYLAKVMWLEQERNVLVLQAEGGPLIGMSLLYGSRITMDIVEFGPVRIDTLV